MSALTAAHWLQTWEQSQSLPVPLRPCAWLAPLLDGGEAAAQALPLGQRDSHLLSLHEALFGRNLQAVVHCPACAQMLELALDCSELRAEAPVDAQLQVNWQGGQVHFRLPDSRDLAFAARGGDLTRAREELLCRCLGRDQTTELPPALLEQLACAMAEADPQSVTELALDCPACGEQWRELFDIGSYLDERFAQWAERLFDQVHLLAQAYGWSEAQVLALSPARRARYLARVLA